MTGCSLPTEERLRARQTQVLRAAVAWGDDAADEPNGLTVADLRDHNPTGEELAACVETMRAWRQLPDTSPDRARGHLVWVLINHNNFVTLR